MLFSAASEKYGYKEKTSLLHKGKGPVLEAESNTFDNCFLGLCSTQPHHGLLPISNTKK